ncbi:MAG: hypothetical protein U0835_25030 [Isosphaeraceae bacterium]
MSASRWPLGLLGAFLLSAGVEGLVARFGPADASFIQANWADVGKSSRAVGPDVGVLCLGDSQVKSGLQPRLMTPELGTPVANLALVGGQAASSALVFERALRAGARPRAVVVGYFPGLLAADLRINTEKWPELLSPGECLDLALTARDARLFAPMMARALIPSLRRRESLRAATLAEFDPSLDEPKGKPPGKGRPEARAYVRNWQVNGGAHVLADNPDFRDEAPASATEFGPHARWKPKAENLAFTRRLLSRAEAAGVRVFWLLPATAPALQAARERSGLHEAYLAVVKNLQREFPRLTVLDPSPLLRDPSRFSDVYHLDRSGASVLSLSVAEALRDSLSGANRQGGWLVLKEPTADPGRAASLLEDLAESSARARPPGAATSLAAGSGASPDTQRR